MKRPWMPLYIGDYLGDTGHLTTTQHGAYLLLMMHYWLKGELPDDDKQLSKITKMPLKFWVEYRPILQDFFYDGWKHKRIDDELRKTNAIREKRAAAGAKGGFWSAIAAQKRMGNDSLSKRARTTANAIQLDTSRIASVQYSQSQSKKEEARQGNVASPELMAILGK